MNVIQQFEEKLFVWLGVKEVDANVDTKLVEVSCEDVVESETVLQALQKWSQSSQKSVELLA